MAHVASMREVVSLDAIQQGFGGGGAKKDSHPFAPTSSKTEGLKNFEEVALVDRVECFLNVEFEEE